MSDPEIAAILRDFISRRLNSMEMLVCHYVAEGRPIHPNDLEEFESLKAMFADEIARYQPQP